MYLKKDDLKNIIEGTAQELAELMIANVFLNRFRDARRAYFINDIDVLEKNQKFFSETPEVAFPYAPICRDILKLRLIIRRCDETLIQDEKYKQLSSLYLTQSEDINLKFFLVELLAVEAIFCDFNKDYGACYEKNKLASQIAKELGLLKKASTLNYNGVVALNHQKPAQVRICLLVDSISLAIKVDDFTTQIAALTSLTQEYESLGCLNLAYEECLKAIELAKKYIFGSFNFCYLLLLGAKLAIGTGRAEIASEYIKLVETFNFTELNAKLCEVKEYLNINESKEILSRDEQRLIALLAEGPKDKYFLIEKIYGAGETESLENRLKQLLLRLRKKKEGLIFYNKKDGLYELAH